MEVITTGGLLAHNLFAVPCRASPALPSAAQKDVSTKIIRAFRKPRRRRTRTSRLPHERSDEGIDRIWARLPEVLSDVLPDQRRLRRPPPSRFNSKRSVNVFVDVDLQPFHMANIRH